ncbi:MAG: acyl-CoA thioesterase [Carbonactinosporaceae bacterium]
MTSVGEADPGAWPGVPASVLVERRLEWRDTDASGHWHHAAALRFVEEAETVLHERLGIAAHTIPRIPRVRIELTFLDRLFYGDRVSIELRVEKVGRSSLTYTFEVRRDDGTLCTEGTEVIVYFDPVTGKPQPWPDDCRTLLAGAGPQEPERLSRG